MTNSNSPSHIPRRRVVVILHNLLAVSESEIAEFLNQAGISADEIEFLTPLALPSFGDFSEATILFFVDSLETSSEELSALVRDLSQKCARLVILISGSQYTDGLHPLAVKYGIQCTWSPEALMACLGSTNPYTWEKEVNPGSTRPDPIQVKC